MKWALISSWVLVSWPPPSTSGANMNDFSQGQAQSHREQRPFGANTQCDKILKALLRGEEISVLGAMKETHATSADRRLREVRTYLGTLGVEVKQKWSQTANARFKVYWLDSEARTRYAFSPQAKEGE